MSAEVIFYDEDGEEISTVDCIVADTPESRYIGLSNTESLTYDEGMLFMYSSEEKRTFVMRNMNFSVDIIMVDSDGSIEEIHEADMESSDVADTSLEEYSGIAEAVVEVNQGYCRDNEIDGSCSVEVIFR